MLHIVVLLIILYGLSSFRKVSVTSFKVCQVLTLSMLFTALQFSTSVEVRPGNVTSTDRLTLPGLSSTEFENCNAVNSMLKART